MRNRVNPRNWLQEQFLKRKLNSYIRGANWTNIFWANSDTGFQLISIHVVAKYWCNLASPTFQPQRFKSQLEVVTSFLSIQKKHCCNCNKGQFFLCARRETTPGKCQWWHLINSCWHQPRVSTGSATSNLCCVGGHKRDHGMTVRDVIKNKKHQAEEKKKKKWKIYQQRNFGLSDFCLQTPGWRGWESDHVPDSCKHPFYLRQHCLPPPKKNKPRWVCTWKPVMLTCSFKHLFQINSCAHKEPCWLQFCSKWCSQGQTVNSEMV